MLPAAPYDSRVMFTRLIWLICFAALAACSPVGPGTGTHNGPGNDPDPPDNEPALGAPGFPEGWEGWDTLGEVARPANSEFRTLHASKKATGAPYPAGSVLVKAHYRLAGNTRGALFQLSVMTKGDGGWAYTVYNPTTKKKRVTESDVCVLCHSQRKDNDFVFSTR